MLPGMTELRGDSARKNALLAAGILAATLLAYIPAMQAGYIWDDDDYLLENESVKQASGIVRTWSDISANPQFYPMVFTTFWIEHQMWGLQPAGYHIVNILLHALSAIFLWRILKRLEIPGAAVAAALFALHPVHVESVAWITERKNVLSGLFYMLSMIAYLRFCRFGDASSNSKRAVLYVASMALFVMALPSKTVTCSLPAVILLILWWKRDRLRWRDFAAIAPMFAIGLAFARITVWMERNVVGAEGTEWGFSIFDRCLIAGRSLWFYAHKIVVPHPLMFNYPRWEIDDTQAWQYIFPVAIIAVLIALFSMRKRIGKGPLIAVLMFAGTLVPAIGFFDVYPFRYSFVADHFQYLASIGIIVLLTGTAAHLLKHNQSLAMIISLLVMLAFGALTFRHSRVFYAHGTLWADTLEKNENSWIASNHLGMMFMQDRPDDAIRMFELTLQIKPDHELAHYNLGHVYVGKGNPEKAIEHLRAAIAIDSSMIDAADFLAAYLIKHNRIEEGFKTWQDMVDRHPDHIVLRLNYADTLRRHDRHTIAIEQYDHVLKIEPSNADAMVGTAKSLNASVTAAETIKWLQQVIESVPNEPRLHNQLGMAFEKDEKADKAEAHYRKALELAPNFINARRNLDRLLKDSNK